MTDIAWDKVIVGALLFDGSGDEPRYRDVAISDGVVVAIGQNLPTQAAGQVIDGGGLWLLPGMLDIHTHLDLEVDLQPGLPEVVRHGTTTVLVGNCSLGTCFGKQETNEQSPIIDCFARVENIPKALLRKCTAVVTWENTEGYLDHLDSIPLGPNIAAFVPHSMLRVEVMGLADSISRDPTEAELLEMERLLSDAMDQGYLGLSTDGMPFHYLANEPFTDRRIPTQFASFREIKRLLRIVRRRDRVWQSTPIMENRAKMFIYFLLTSGRLFGQTLKTSALVAMEFVEAPQMHKGLLGFAALANSWLLQGKIHFQALSTNFRVWADGIVSPAYEELDTTCMLIAKEHEDREGRLTLLNDDSFISQFRHEWLHGRRGFNLAHLKTKLGVPDSLVTRDLSRFVFDGAPVADWDGETMEAVFNRLQKFQRGGQATARSEEERAALEYFPNPIRDDADFMLHMMRHYDKSFRFWTDAANVGRTNTLDLLLNKHCMPGFNDSGAHITNMAFFDGNLTALKLAQGKSLKIVGHMVHRLTQEPAEFFGLDAGRVAVGARADLVLIDPSALAQWDCNETRELIYRPELEHEQMVNRPEGVVRHVLIAGNTAWEEGELGRALGTERLGSVLRVGTDARVA